MAKTKFTVKEVKDVLNRFVKKGYLKKVRKNGEWYYQDSDMVTAMLKKGKTRLEIANILEKKAVEEPSDDVIEK